MAQHLGDELGRVLQVGIHDDHAVAGDVIEAGQHGSFLAVVAREVEVVDAGVFLVEAGQDGQCVVAAAVVDEEHLPRGGGVCVHHVG